LRNECADGGRQDHGAIMRLANVSAWDGGYTLLPSDMQGTMLRVACVANGWLTGKQSAVPPSDSV
jgi:hypothetical protein